MLKAKCKLTRILESKSTRNPPVSPRDEVEVYLNLDNEEDVRFQLVLYWATTKNREL